MRRLVLVAMLLAGCASAAPAPPASRPSPPDADTASAAPAICVPPGMPAFSEWKPLPGGQMYWAKSDASGGEVVVMRHYKVGGQHVDGVMASGRRLYVVDPAPDDEKVPAWYDAGLARDAGDREYVLLAEPGERCQWRRGGLERV
ncbi:MAG: hypothetical protein Q8S13_14730 [Dehalococcoidia bacterium]|nr:hypothetical protein [Dehalococcoidia bacterium]